MDQIENFLSGKKPMIKLTKTKNGSKRDIPLNTDAVTAFRSLYARRPHDGRIFQSKFGEDLNTPRKWFEEALEEAQIEDFTWHSLRHTFISVVMKGARLMEVKSWPVIKL